MYNLQNYRCTHMLLRPSIVHTFVLCDISSLVTKIVTDIYKWVYTMGYDFIDKYYFNFHVCSFF